MGQQLSTSKLDAAVLQIEDAFYFLPSPYPEGKTVGAVRHTSAILDQATGREVPLSEVGSLTSQALYPSMMSSSSNRRCTWLALADRRLLADLADCSWRVSRQGLCTLLNA